MVNSVVFSDNERWAAVQNRDAAYDGKFVFAVRTTGVFCRPSCHARQPKRENVRFFVTTADAVAAGYRPCRRCQPDSVDPAIATVTQICQYLDVHTDDNLTLADLGRVFSLSPYYLQRIFKRVMGISPRQYTDARRQALVKQALKAGEKITDAVYGAGYNSGNRLYEGQLGMTPTEYKSGGAGLHVRYSVAPCSLGLLLTASTPRGICAVRLGDSREALQTDLRREFPAADLTEDDAHLSTWSKAILAYLDRQRQSLLDVPLDVQATAFQRQVWEALRRIPYGETRSYQQVADAVGAPNAARAVARACATNPAALVIPCHRVVGADGRLSGYRWGVERKKRLLDTEKAVVTSG